MVYEIRIQVTVMKFEILPLDYQQIQDKLQEESNSLSEITKCFVPGTHESKYSTSFKIYPSQIDAVSTDQN